MEAIIKGLYALIRKSNQDKSKLLNQNCVNSFIYKDLNKSDRICKKKNG